MDEYAEFASDDFDVKGWINATVAGHLDLAKSNGEAVGNGVAPGESPSLSSSTSHSGLDTHLSTVATKLQAVSTSINAGLEKSMVEIMVSVPRVVTEVERVEASIKTLHAELSNLSGQLEEIDHGANAHVETLARLDLVKTHMGDCLHTLTEAASWNALVREVNARFGQEDLKGVAERLEAMVRSMAVLKDMPEAEDRAATLTGLQERLEDLLQPKLLELPGVYFYYEVSPVQALVEEKRRGFLSFLTGACGVVGGVYTILGLVNAGINGLLSGKGSHRSR